MYIVTDDLIVTPMASVSSVSYLNRLKVQLFDIEERVISIGMKEVRRWVRHRFFLCQVIHRILLVVPDFIKFVDFFFFLVQALAILEASLTSISSLTNGLKQFTNSINRGTWSITSILLKVIESSVLQNRFCIYIFQTPGYSN